MNSSAAQGNELQQQLSNLEMAGGQGLAEVPLCRSSRECVRFFLRTASAYLDHTVLKQHHKKRRAKGCRKKGRIAAYGVKNFPRLMMSLLVIASLPVGPDRVSF